MNKQKDCHIKRTSEWICLCAACQPNKTVRNSLKRLGSKRVRQYHKDQIEKEKYVKGLKE